MQKHKLLLSLLASTLILGLGRGELYAAPADDISRLRAQLLEQYRRGAPEARTVEGYIQALRPDGSWPDVDYANKEPGSWLTQRHLSRLLAMAAAYNKPDHPLAGNAELRLAILKALAHWTEKDYVNPNWWYMQIGVPQTMAPILLLMGPAVPPELKTQTIQRVLGRSKMGMTGQNKVWLAGIAFMRGLLENDPGLMAQAHDQIFSELRITTQEGVQPDYSFHQHGPQLQWGNYGSSFGSDMIHWANIFRGTSYALEAQRLEVLRGYLQEGPAWVVWKGRMDISGCGRQIFRGCQPSKGRSALRQLESMKSIDPSQAHSYTRLIAATSPEGPNTLVGNRHFWRSDITVHRRPTWYASVKMSSTRTIGAETCNGENLPGLHLGDGVTYFYRTGTEYDDLFPVWDWRRLPGTTCRQDPGSLEPNPRACRGRSSFVGGLSDGTCGMATQEYRRDSLRARKAWFFLENAVVCLGAGIECSDPEAALTSVNQCVLNGRVTLGTNQQVSDLPKGERLSRGLQWVHHDRIAYLFVDPTAVTVCAQTQRGNWHQVHSRESSRTVERDVFSLWIDHGSHPRDGQYAYLVVPDVDVAVVPSLYRSLPATVLRQTASTLAISSRHGKLVQAVFFEPGQLAWGRGSSIEVDAPCLVALDSTGGDVIYLSAVDPTQARRTLTMRLAGRFIGPGAMYDGEKGQTELTISLPREGDAGHTVGLELQPAKS